MRGAACFCRRRQVLGFALAAAAVLTGRRKAGAAEASIDVVVTVARALAFLERPPAGIAKLGIGYPAASEAARQEATLLAERLKEVLASRRLTLRPQPIALEDLGQAQLAVLLLLEEALPHAAQVASELAGRGVLTVSRDPAPVLAGHVVMSVTAGPRIEIIVSREAAQRAGIRFVSAFRMLIQER